MAQRPSRSIYFYARLPVLVFSLFLLLLINGSRANPQALVAQAQASRSDVSESAGRLTTITPDPLIQTMIDQVDPEDISTYDRQLAGELPAPVDGGWYTISTRYTYSGTPIQKTTSFVGQHMALDGLDIEYHQWGGITYPNVIGEIAGQNDPDRIFIIGAHIDDAEGSPGADDNASGSVATLIAADILSQYTWGCTLRFAFWTGEEEGLLGSEAYAQRSYQLGEDVEGYLNLDMIAWNTVGSSPGIDLIYSPSLPATHDLVSLFSDVVSAYGINLVPEIYPDSSEYSDHYSFWQQGYTAMLAIEDFDDFNPYYHTPWDTPAYTNLGYFTDFVKASIGTFAHMGCLLQPSGSLVGTVTDAKGDPIPSAHIQASSSASQPAETISNVDGTYGMDLVSGTYTVTAQAPGYMDFAATGIVVTAGYTTTLDITMLAMPTFTITGYVKENLSGEPLPAIVSVVGSAITPIHTDPATGFYTLSLIQGTYTLKAEHPDHHSVDKIVNLTEDQRVDFYLPTLCLLVVGDDARYGSYYTSALDQLGYDYQYVTQSPDLAQLSYYQGAVWLTGDQVTGTLTQSDQAALASYLDGGGSLFISGQNIAQDIGGGSFFGDYLHASYMEPGSGLYVLNGLGPFNHLVDIFIQDGDGGNNQNSPDVIRPANGGAGIYQYWSDPLPAPAKYGGVAYNGVAGMGTYRTVYFSFGYEAINRSLDRRNVLATALDYMGVCTSPNPPRPYFHAFQGAGGLVQFTNESQGAPLMTYTWDFGDSSPPSSMTNPRHTFKQPSVYWVKLTASSRYGQAWIIGEIPVWHEVYLPTVNK